jgi:response regulator RpfG family c-di-GMP phosphodiesterase
MLADRGGAFARCGPADMTRTSGINQRIADRLLSEGRISGDQHRLAVAHATRHRMRIEDALVELDILKEGDLLKYIATVYGTRFVSTEKLSKAVIDPRVLAKVAKRTAELYGVFPVLLDDAASVLSIVTADPDNDAAMHEIKLAARVKEVRALVARPGAVRAAIQQYYNGDLQAFAALLRPALPLDYYQSGFDRQLPTERHTPEPAQRAFAPGPPAPPPQAYAQPPAPPPQAYAQPPAPPPQAYPQHAQPMQPAPGYGAQPMQPPPQMQAPYGASMEPMQPQMGQPGFPQMGQPMQFSAPQQPMQYAQPVGFPQHAQPAIGFGPAMQPALGQMPPPVPPTTPAGTGPAPATLASVAEGPRVPPVPPRSALPDSAADRPTSTSPSVSVQPTSTHEYTETLNVLVSLLENARAELRGHSATVARLMKKTCERIGLPASSVNAFVLAAYLHDLGKMGTYHLTSFNVAEYEGHRIAALKVVDLPAQLLASVGLPAETMAAIGAMYERYDGQGFPNGQAGKEIPLGARILSVADTYADLTQNPRNPFRKILRPIEACEALDQFRGKIFDPNIVDLFRQAMTGDDMRARLLDERHHVLIVDPDPEETTVLELRLIEQGFEVRIARTSAQAKHELSEREGVTAVVSEIDLEEPAAGLELRQEALRESWGQEPVWVFLTAKTDRQTAQQAFDLKVDDFVSKPASGDILAAKLRQLIERRTAKEGGRGVSGSLAEMGLPDMVQILWHGRKTCALKINARGQAGEIDFADGQIVHATWGSLKGEDAFYKMLALREGDFRLDPTYTPSIRSIQASPEGLLLEGMRRLDEGTVVAD